MKAASIILILIVCGSCSEWWRVSNPTCPGLIEGAIIAPGSLQIKWTKVNKVDGYRIYRDGKMIADLSAIATSYVDENLKSKTVYTYEVNPYTFGTEVVCSYADVTIP